MGLTLEREMASPDSSKVDVSAAYAAHGEHVWRSLHRLGVPAADLADLAQDVFVVVHRRRAEYDASSPMRGWLWGICVGLVRNYRKRAFRHGQHLAGHRHAEQSAEGAEHSSGGDAEDALDASRRAERGQRALRELEPERRAVFVMFEVEGMSGRAIAEALEVPLGTVHSRLHAARAELARALDGKEQP